MNGLGGGWTSENEQEHINHRIYELWEERISINHGSNSLMPNLTLEKENSMTYFFRCGICDSQSIHLFEIRRGDVIRVRNCDAWMNHSWVQCQNLWLNRTEGNVRNEGNPGTSLLVLHVGKLLFTVSRVVCSVYSLYRDQRIIGKRLCLYLLSSVRTRRDTIATISYTIDTIRQEKCR